MTGPGDGDATRSDALSDPLVQSLRAEAEARPRAGEEVIRVEGLNHYFGEGETRNQVLFENELAISAGEIVIMTGPSGSGKTTLLTLIGGLRTVQEGSVRVLGREMRGLGAAEMVRVRRDIGFIFQAHNLFESLTARQNVRMALELNEPVPRDRDARAREVLERLGLGERIDYKPEQLSGGQRQRVAIARALVNKPRLILADEPTAALDEKSGATVMELLQQLAREEGCTSLIVTHDNRILKVADRIVNMVGGRIRSNVLVKESLLLIEYLRRCVVFAGLTPDALTGVAEKMTREAHAPGAAIVRQGEEGDKFYLVRRGEVDVIVGEGTPQRRVVNTLREGDYFGERALMTGEPRNATVRARGEVETYALGKDDFQRALATTAPFIEQIRRVYFQRQ
ncbi:MAG TPA: ATP-binding cassette domain-containing protein [Gemmataceae bacterium]